MRLQHFSQLQLFPRARRRLDFFHRLLSHILVFHELRTTHHTFVLTARETDFGERQKSRGYCIWPDRQRVVIGWRLGDRGLGQGWRMEGIMVLGRGRYYALQPGNRTAGE